MFQEDNASCQVLMFLKLPFTNTGVDPIGGKKGSFHYAVIFTIDPLGLFVVSTLFSTMNLSGRDSVEHLEC